MTVDTTTMAVKVLRAYSSEKETFQITDFGTYLLNYNLLRVSFVLLYYLLLLILLFMCFTFVSSIIYSIYLQQLVLLFRTNFISYPWMYSGLCYKPFLHVLFLLYHNQLECLTLSFTSTSKASGLLRVESYTGHQ